MVGGPVPGSGAGCGPRGGADRRLLTTPVHALRVEHGGDAIAPTGFVIAAALLRVADEAAAQRARQATGSLWAQAETGGFAIWCFGAGTGVAAALWAAEERFTGRMAPPSRGSFARHTRRL